MDPKAPFPLIPTLIGSARFVVIFRVFKVPGTMANIVPGTRYIFSTYSTRVSSDPKNMTCHLLASRSHYSMSHKSFVRCCHTCSSYQLINSYRVTVAELYPSMLQENFVRELEVQRESGGRALRVL